MDQSSVREHLSLLRNKAVLIYPKFEQDVIQSDPTDNKFLECAVEAEADFLITGNVRDFDFADFRGVRIVQPHEFSKLVVK